MTSRMEFMTKLDNLIDASIPIIVTRTREPQLVLTCLNDWVSARNQTRYQKFLSSSDRDTTRFKGPQFSNWNIIRGWSHKMGDDFIAELEDPDHVGPFVAGGATTVEPINALAAVCGLLTPPNEASPYGDGIYAMQWPHSVFKLPMLSATLHDYAYRLISDGKKLLLILPETENVPSELHDFVAYLDFAPPTKEEREIILNDTLEAFDLVGKVALDEMGKTRILSAGAGMTEYELNNALSRAVVTLKTPEAMTSEAICDIVLKLKTEMVKRSEVLEVMSHSSMSDIGGLDNLKDQIREWSQCFSDEAKEFGVDTPKGIGLFGPPGTGKSMCAKAIGHELGLPVIKFDVSRVFNALVGSSEERIRSALKLVASMSPCVACIDEVDKAFNQNSGGGDSGVGSRVLGTLLTFLQECTDPIFWVFTGNSVDGLPPEMLRKGRLDEIFSVTVPNVVERAEIFAIHLRKRKQDPETIPNLKEAAEGSEGYVAAELESAVKQAIIKAFVGKIPLTGDLILAQLRSSAALSTAFKAKFEAMQSWAENNARPASRIVTSPAFELGEPLAIGKKGLRRTV